jgi:hypothetical protein
MRVVVECMKCLEVIYVEIVRLEDGGGGDEEEEDKEEKMIILRWVLW